MSTTTTIRCTRDTYINSSGSNNEGANELYVSASSQSADSRTATAFLQFGIPSLIKYKKITSAKLYFNYTATLSGSGAGSNQIIFYYAPFSASESISGITVSNLSNYGAYGSAISDVLTYAITSGSYSGNRIVDVTSLLQNSTYNDLFTFTIAAYKSIPSYVTVKSTENENGYPYLEITYEDVTPSADTPIYPIDVYLKQSEEITFRWAFNSESKSSQASYTLKCKKKTDSTYTVIATGTTELSHTVQANTMPLGAIDWSIDSTDNLGLVAPTAYASFNVVGKPSAPIITNVKNDAMTQINWNASDQSARELQLISNGVLLASDSQSVQDTTYKPNLLLKNGTYEFRIRIMNTFGFWSDWTSYIFTISATEPTAPSISTEVIENAIKINVTPSTEITYIYRDGIPIAKINSLEEGQYIIDSYLPAETVCSYFARAYNGGIIDSAISEVQISVDGFVLNCEGNEVIISEAQDNFMPLKEYISDDSVLVYYEGREFPTQESSIRQSRTIERTYFIDKDGYKTLKAIRRLQKPILYRDSEGNKMYCSMSPIDASLAVLNTGFSLTTKFTQVEYDEAVKINE